MENIEKIVLASHITAVLKEPLIARTMTTKKKKHGKGCDLEMIHNLKQSIIP